VDTGGRGRLAEGERCSLALAGARGGVRIRKRGRGRGRLGDEAEIVAKGREEKTRRLQQNLAVTVGASAKTRRPAVCTSRKTQTGKGREMDIHNLWRVSRSRGSGS